MSTENTVENLLQRIIASKSFYATSPTYDAVIATGSAAVEPTIALLNSGDQKKYHMAFILAHRMKDPRIADALLAFMKRLAAEGLTKDNMDLFRRAASAIGDVGASHVAAELKAMLTLPLNPVARNTLITAAVKLGEWDWMLQIADQWLDDKKERLSAVELVRQFKDPRVIPPLLKALASRDPLLMGIVILTLGELKAKEAVEPLIALLQSQDWRARAADALGSIGDKRAIEPLLEVAHDQHVAWNERKPSDFESPPGRDILVSEIVQDALRKIQPDIVIPAETAAKPKWKLW